MKQFLTDFMCGNLSSSTTRVFSSLKLRYCDWDGGGVRLTPSQPSVDAAGTARIRERQLGSSGLRERLAAL